jgi:glycogen debranching enzyme
MDGESGLVFSPSHFTWMDTNFPAGTPRQGYPIEIQALWHASLAFLAELEPGGRWAGLAELVRNSIAGYFTLNKAALDSGSPASRPVYLSDCLHAAPGQPARAAAADDALRPNQLLAITLGAVEDKLLRRNILATCEELLVPGAIRTLADRLTSYPLPVENRGRLLNDPHRPYWGAYKGDEDTRRKPAYHNGTAWTWLFPSYCEALFLTYGRPARDRALAILSSSTELINQTCIGHVPEIADGNSPHLPRGCGAQAWSASELCRALAILAPTK